jgi:hypothetical protein
MIESNIDLSPAAAAEPIEFDIYVEPGAFDRADVPVCVPIKLDINPSDVKSVTVRDDAVINAGQVTHPGLLAADANANAELHFVLQKLSRGEKRKRLAVRVYTDKEVSHIVRSFAWQDTPGTHSQLSFGDKPVLRYMYEKLDTSTAERRDATIKPYHHVYDPAGDTIITKGHGGLFTHHRGLFFGFNKVTYDGNKPADVWHCRNGESQQHVAAVSEEAGPVLGRHRLKIQWRGRKDDVFAIEHRELTAYATPRGTLIDFASRVETTGGEIKLDGDPQHAGFHFRASNDVAENTKAETYYLRPDGKGEPGETRNWPGHENHVDLPWNAMSFVVDGLRYTALYMDSPTNPKQARFSERDYGRFGSYFEYTITKDKPLAVAYRVWVQRGELKPKEAQDRDKNFDEPVKVTFK